MPGPRYRGAAALALAVVLIGPAATRTPAAAQTAPRVFGPKPAPVQTRQFGDLAEGPYNRLVIRNVMVIPGHGGPPTGPHDILIEGNVITQTRGHNPRAQPWTGDRVIEGNGMYVMPGMFDLHYHVRTEPMSLEYSYYLKLAHGVTTAVTVPDGRFQQVWADQQAAERYEKLAPRQHPFWDWGQGANATREQLQDPAEAPRIAREMIAAGGRAVGINGLTWNPELFGAAAKAVTAAGGVTTVHIPPSNMSVIHAVDAARLGVTFIKHHYGLAESALPRRTQLFPRDYNYNDENHRFRQAARVWEEVGWDPEARWRLLEDVADSLVHYGTKMLPTMVVYEASRDILRAQGLPWHEKYTHQALLEWNVPSPDWHGAFHWDWTHDDEESWRYAFDLWGDLIYAFNRRGGIVAMGTDDNYIWATAGFSNVRELQLVRESGMHTLEVLKAATYNSARALLEPNLGLIRPGFLADLILVDGNPAENLRYLYSFGAIRMDGNGRMYRTRGIVHTIKDGVVIENANLMREVEREVAESRRNARPLITQQPFVTSGRFQQ
jgi:hypothetical protein